MKPLIVLGTHRSGTSLIAELLHESGVFMGNNINSHFESIEYLKLNQLILQIAHADWDVPNNIEYLFNQKAKRKEIVKLINKQIKSFSFNLNYWGYNKFIKNKSSINWGWKEPRTTVTFPIWKEIYPEAKLLVINRNGIDVAASLYNREKKRETLIDKNYYSTRCLSLEESFKLWEEYNELLYFHLKDFNQNDVYEIKYEDFLVNPHLEISKIIGDFLMEDKFVVTQKVKNVKSENAYIFLKDKDLIDFYEKKRFNNTMTKLGYNNLI
jgi:hypothetical protein